MLDDARLNLANQRPYCDWVECAERVLWLPLVLRAVSSAADFGCNCGHWLYVLAKHGITDFVGVDVFEAGQNLLIPRERYIKHDLSKPLNLGRRFDLVMGLETAEHLRGGDVGANNYVDTLTLHGDYVLFSAATPNQGGRGHVNERPHEYWHQKFQTRGYVTLDIIRPRIKPDPRVYWWYRKNCFMYIKPQTSVYNVCR